MQFYLGALALIASTNAAAVPQYNNPTWTATSFTAAPSQPSVTTVNSAQQATNSFLSSCSWCNYNELYKYTKDYYGYPSADRLKETYDLALQSVAAEFSGTWLSPPLNSSLFEATTSPYAPVSVYQPFTRRLLVNANDRLIVWGDIHGGFSTLIGALRGISSSSDPNACMDRDTLKLKDNCRIIFLGDFTDRGARSIEVVYTIMILRIINGDKVQINNGNHENPRQNNKTKSYPTTNREIRLKYATTGAEQIISALDRFYQFLPSAIFVGVKPTINTATEVQYMQFSHGAIEIAYTPLNLLAAPTNGTSTTLHEYIPVLNGSAVLSRLQEVDPALHLRIVQTLSAQPEWAPYTFNISMTTTDERSYRSSSQYMWSDLMDVANSSFPDFNYDDGRGIVIGYPLAEGLLKAASTSGVAQLRGVIRGHQHSGEMLQRLIRSRGFVDWYSNGNGSDSLCREVISKPSQERFIGTALAAAESGFSTTEDTMSFAARTFVDITCGSTWAQWAINHKWYNNGDYVTCSFGPSQSPSYTKTLTSLPASDTQTDDINEMTKGTI